MNEGQKEQVRKILIQLALFIDGGSEAIEDYVADGDAALYRFDQNQKAIIERSLIKILEVLA